MSPENTTTMKKSFLPLLFTTIALGILLPIGEHLKLLLPGFLSTLLFFNFYQMTFERDHFFQPETWRYALGALLIAPCLVFFTTGFLPTSFRHGLFLATISPAAISGTVVVGIIGGSRELSVANIVIYNLLSPFSYTFLMGLFFHADDLYVPIRPIVTKLVLMVFVPFILSLVLKRIKRAAPLLQTLSSYTNILFLLMIFTAVSSSSLHLRTVPGNELLVLAGLVFMIAGGFYLFGFLMGTRPASGKALIVNLGQKNHSLCIWLALSNFGPLAAVPPTIYIIVQHIYNSLLMYIVSRQKTESAAKT